MGDSTLLSTPERISLLQLVLWKALTDALDPNRDTYENIIRNAYQPQSNPHGGLGSLCERD